MAHLDSSYDSYETFLTPTADSDWTLDGTWSVRLSELNDSGVDGRVVLGLSTEAGGTQRLNVSVTATGLTPLQNHAQHIHGTFDASGAPTDATTPTLAQDDDGDEFIEVLEGVETYGDILLALLQDNGNFPFANVNGTVAFIKDYDLGDASNFVSPVTGNEYSAEDLFPLVSREVVVHGVDVEAGVGAGTDGEVDGSQDGYVPILPAAAGEIFEVSADRALEFLDEQEDVASETFILGSGNDFLFTGLGQDFIFGASGNDSVFGGEGDDDVYGGAGDDNIGGGIGDDAVGGGDGDDIVSGFRGDDSLFGGNGLDTLYGGAGDDTVLGGAGGDVIFAGADSDIVYGDFADDTIFAGRGEAPDTSNAANAGASGSLAIGDYDNGYAGGWGDDTINGGSGSDIITGDDDSRVSVEAEATFNASADGSDAIFGGAGNDEIHTGSWADGDDGFGNTHTGSRADLARGGTGNDIIRGAGGNDSLYGDAGDDDIGGGGGNDIVVGNDGDDLVAGNDGNDRVSGGSGADTLLGGNGDDALYGGTGVDDIIGGSGDDFIFGGSGTDAFYHDGSAALGTDTIADFSDAEFDFLFFQGAEISGDDFQLQQVSGGGDANVGDILVTYTPSGEVLWNILDATNNSELLVRDETGPFIDLFA